MSEILEGIGVISLGVCTILWILIKIVSCIMIAGLISTRIGHLSGYYWWFSSIILFSILSKLVFYNNDTNPYTVIVDKYNKKYTPEEDTETL